MNTISKRLDKVEQAIAPRASNEVRFVWVDGKDDGSAKIAELQAAGFQGQIITIGWRRAFDNAEHA